MNDQSRALTHSNQPLVPILKSDTLYRPNEVVERWTTYFDIPINKCKVYLKHDVLKKTKISKQEKVKDSFGGDAVVTDFEGNIIREQIVTTTYIKGYDLFVFEKLLLNEPLPSPEDNNKPSKPVKGKPKTFDRWILYYHNNGFISVTKNNDDKDNWKHGDKKKLLELAREEGVVGDDTKENQTILSEETFKKSWQRVKRMLENT